MEVLADTNGYDVLIAMAAMVAAVVPTLLGVLVLWRKVVSIDRAVNNRVPGSSTIGQDVAEARRRDEAQDEASTDPEAPSRPGAADRSASATEDEPDEPT